MRKLFLLIIFFQNTHLYSLACSDSNFDFLIDNNSSNLEIIIKEGRNNISCNYKIPLNKPDLFNIAEEIIINSNISCGNQILTCGDKYFLHNNQIYKDTNIYILSTPEIKDYYLASGRVKSLYHFTFNIEIIDQNMQKSLECSSSISKKEASIHNITESNLINYLYLPICTDKSNNEFIINKDLVFKKLSSYSFDELY